MIFRYVPNTGLKLPVFSLGSWLTADKGGDAAMEEILRAAYDAGCNFFDTAEVYGNGEAESVLGRILKKTNWPRSTYVLSTKVFWGPNRNEIVGKNDCGLSRKHIIEGLRASLARLDVPYVDIVYAHRPDPETPIEETVRAFNWCIDQGLAFYWGVSEWSAQQIADAYAVAERLHMIPPVVEQPQYNMFEREKLEREYTHLFQRGVLGTTIWSPLASGILTGKYLEGIPEGSRLARTDNWVCKRIADSLKTEEGKAKLNKVKDLGAIAAKLECSLAQLALAWCAKNENVTSVILGASRVSQLKENLGALAVIPKLTPEVMQEIEDVLQNKPAAWQNFRE